jgi:endonuclease YncB( thermonuclease family)
MRGPRHFLAAAAAVLLLAASPSAAEQVYRVARVIDGDTIVTLEHGRIRFAITAAPETAGRARCPREAALAERPRTTSPATSPTA